MLQEKLESACMDNLLPPPLIRLCQGVTVGASVLKYRLQPLSDKKKGSFFLPEPIGGRESEAWRCNVNLK